MADIVKELRHEADCFAGLQSASKLVRVLSSAADEIERLRGRAVPVADTSEDLKALYVATHGSDAGWLGVEGSYFISGVQAAERLRGGAVPDDVAKDAARYRWLRAAGPGYVDFSQRAINLDSWPADGKATDAVIDAAMLAAAPTVAAQVAES